jgi:hypothetical protein
MWFYYTPAVGETIYEGLANRPVILEIAEMIRANEFDSSKIYKLQELRKKNLQLDKFKERRELVKYAEAYIQKVNFNDRPTLLNSCIMNNQLDTIQFYKLLDQSKFLSGEIIDPALFKSKNLQDDVLMNLFDGKLKERYKAGTELAGLTYSFQNLITFLFALMLPLLANKLGQKMAHQLCLTVGGIGLISMSFIHGVENQLMLFFVMGAVGISWASILSMPYAMLADCLPSNKIGVYMGIFNFFIVLPEIIATLTFGWVMQTFLDNNRVLAVAIGGGLLILAGILTLRINNTKIT